MEAKRKFTKWVVGMVILVITSFIIPYKGTLSLVKLALTLMLGWIVTCGIVVITILMIKHKGPIRKRIISIVTGIIMLVVAAISTKDLVMDICEGPQTVILEKASVGANKGTKVFFTFSYFVEGITPENKKINVKISADDYERLKGRNTVVITYYAHSNVIGE